MPRWTLAGAPSGAFPDDGRPATPQGAVVVLAAGLLALTMAGCSVGASGGEDAAASSNSLLAGSASAGATGSATSGTSSGAGTTGATSTPPPGSGATAQGITPTTPPPIVPRGSSKTPAACRRMYATITRSIAGWNAVHRNDTGAVLKAAQELTKAAGVIGPVAKSSGDSTLVSLTGRVATQLKRVDTDYSAGKKVDGASLTKVTTDLWTYCRSAP